MSVSKKCLGILIIAAVFVPALAAQSPNAAGLNGATGLYTVPTGRIGWGDTNLGLDFGYRAILSDTADYDFLDDNGYRLNHLGFFSASLFKWAEVGLAFDFQPTYNKFLGDKSDSNSDLLFNFKIQLPTEVTAFAFGGNFQAINIGNEAMYYSAIQIYAATTYTGTFFTLPAETTVSLGKTFAFGDQLSAKYLGKNWDFDFGMGFDLGLFPNAFKGVVHWLIDYSNFSYSANPWGTDPWRRGTLNTGLRFDLAALPALSKYKFTIDALMTDLFDENLRSFSFGLSFGVPILK
jgi:hypothetical protein